MIEVDRILDYDVHDATKKYKPYRAGGLLLNPVRYVIKKLTTMLQDVASFLYRAIPSGVANGYGTIEKIEGNTLVWNQLVDDSQSISKWGSGATLTFMHTSRTYVGVCVSAGYLGYYIPIPLIPDGHKVLISVGLTSSVTSQAYNVRVSRNGGNAHKFPLTANTPYQHKAIETISNGASDTSTFIVFEQTVGTTASFAVNDTFEIVDLNVQDLTQMFGAGNEPTTVAEFEALYPLNYYDYNAGELISNSMSGIETYDSNNLLLDSKTIDVTTITGINTATNQRETCFPYGMNKSNGEADVIDGDTASKKTDRRAYTAGDESDTTVVTDGTNTIYELTTPITYTDLQDGNGNPLVLPKYEVEVGGTEQILPVGTASSVIAAPTLDIVYNKPNS